MASQEVKLKVIADAKQGFDEFKKFEEQVRKSFDAIKGYASQTSTDVKNMKQMFGGFKSTASNMTKGFSKAGQDITQLRQQLDLSLGSTIRLGAAFSAMFATFHLVKNTITNVVNTVLEFERAQRLLNSALGDGRRAFEYIQDRAFKYGLTISQLATDFSQFTAAAAESNLSLGQQRYIFESMSISAGALGMSVDRTRLAFLALRQMLSKQRLGTQEIIRQLGDHIPGAINIAAKAMNMAAGEFLQFVKRGEILAEDFLPKFAIEMRKSFEEPAKEAARSLQGSLNNIKNAFQVFYHELGRAGGSQGVAAALRDISEQLRSPATLAAARQLSQTIATLSKAFAAAVKVAYQYKEVLIALGVAWGAMKVINWIKDISSTVYAFFKLISTTYATMIAKQKASIAIAQETAAAVKNTIAINANTKAHVGNLLASANFKRVKAGTIPVIKTSTAAIAGSSVVTGKAAAQVGLLSKAWTALKATMIASPWGWTVAGITALGIAVGYFWKRQNDANRAVEAANIAERERIKALSSTLLSLRDQAEMLEVVNDGTDEYRKITNGMQETVAEFNREHGNLLEGLQFEGKTRKEINEQLEKEIINRRKLVEIQISERRERKAAIEREMLALKDQMEATKREIDNVSKSFSTYGAASTAVVLQLNANFQKLQKRLKALAEEYKGFDDIIQDLEKSLSYFDHAVGGLGGGIPSKSRMMTWREHMAIITDEKTKQLKLENQMYAIQGQQMEMLKAEMNLIERRKDIASSLEHAEINLLKLRKDGIISQRMYEMRLNEARATARKETEQAEFAHSQELLNITNKHIADETKKWEDYYKAQNDLQEAVWDTLEQTIELRKERINREIDDMINTMQTKAIELGLGDIADEDRQKLEAQRRHRIEEAERKRVEDWTKRINEAIQERRQELGGLTKNELQDLIYGFQTMRDAMAPGHERDLLDEALDKVTKLSGAFDSLGTTVNKRVNRYLEDISYSFVNFADSIVDIMYGVERAISRGFQSLFDSSMSGAEKLKQFAVSMKDAVVNALSDLIAKQIAYSLFEKMQSKFRVTTKQKEAASVVAANQVQIASSESVMSADTMQTGVIIANSTARTAAKTGEGASGFWAWFSGLGPFGVPLAIAAIAAMIMSIKAATKAFALGGVVDGPTLALLGEGGQREFVAPEITFDTWGRQLAANIMARQDAVNALRYETNAAIDSASSGVISEQITYNVFPIHDKRKISAIVAEYLQFHNRRV